MSSHLLSIEWAREGFRYQSNATRLFGRGAAPFRTAWGIWELPISYMDNMDMWFGRNWTDAPHVPFAKDVIAAALACESVYVFDFHPMHIAFNSSSPEDYAQKRIRHATGTSAWSLGSSGAGVRTFFERVLQAIADSGAATSGAGDAVRSAERGLDRLPRQSVTSSGPIRGRTPSGRVAPPWNPRDRLT